MKVRLVEEKNLDELDSTQEALGIEEPDYFVEMLPPIVVRVPPAPSGEPSKLLVDTTMVGEVLTFLVENTTSAVWRKCYPGGFWIRDGRRLGPSTKSQCLGDIQPGVRMLVDIVVPMFPSVRPDWLRVAILEDGVRWHKVEDVRVR